MSSFQERLNNTIDRYHCSGGSSTKLPATITKWTFIRLFVIITRLLAMITRLLCIVTLHVARTRDRLTDSLGVPVSVSAAADPDLASRYSRAEVTEVTRIYEEDNTNTATATARPHSCCTDTVSTVCLDCLVPLTPLLSEYIKAPPCSRQSPSTQ